MVQYYNIKNEFKKEFGADGKDGTACLKSNERGPIAMDKKQYVKSQGQTRFHTCHWPKCDKQIPPAMWGCKLHWIKLPMWLRDKIWEAYKPGQEVRMDPSDEYMDVMTEVDNWIREKL